MRIVAIACVRDERDIIEPFVRHTLAVADRLLVVDNGSSDGTREMLDALAAEPLPVETVDDPSPGKYLSERLTRLMQEAAIPRRGADWILPLDADEFVVPGPGGLVPSGVPPNSPFLLPWRSYVPHSTDDLAEINPVTRMRWRLAHETETLTKIVVPAVLGRQESAMIAQGSHELFLNGRPCPSHLDPGGYLAHYPIRSAIQFLVKTVIGHLQNEVVPFRQSQWGWHHRENYERLTADPAELLADLQRLAARYSCLPRGPELPPLVADALPYRGGPLRYTPATPADLLHAWPPVLKYLQDLARRYALQSAADRSAERAASGEEADLFTFLRRQLAERDAVVERLRIDAEGRDAAIETLRADAEALRRTLEDVARELSAAAAGHDRLRRSHTWKVGRAVLAPARLVRHGWAARHRLRLPISFRR